MSVIIPALNAGDDLAACLRSLSDGVDCGLIREGILADGGSSDQTEDIARAAGLRVVRSRRGRGLQLRAGADIATGEWLLFLHADTVLDSGWIKSVKGSLGDPKRFSVFRLRFRDRGLAPAIVARGAMARTKLLSLPFGDQGLLISRLLYKQSGGYQPLALFEDVEFIERLTSVYGKRSLRIMKATASTSASRYKERGYLHQVGKNALRLVRYKSGADIERLAAEY
ncbi:MAG: TIGR04283 family arsenosugar biosynthesis glycosyltransferase [Pseudomonadota bacterium]